MKDGFIKTAVVTPQVKLANCSVNSGKMREIISQAYETGAKLLVLPMLGVTGCTCQDIFFQNTLLDEAQKAVTDLASSVPSGLVAVFGAPLRKGTCLYNCAVVATAGRILGVVPQVKPDSTRARWFASAPAKVSEIVVGEENVPFGKDLVFECSAQRNFKLGCAVGDFRTFPKDATVIACLAGSNTLPGKKEKLEKTLSVLSTENICTFVYADAGEGESTTDLVFTGENLIVENGEVLVSESHSEESMFITETDVSMLASHRMKNHFEGDSADFVSFELSLEETVLTRKFSQNPFIPEDEDEREQFCSETLRLQALGLKHRLEHTRSETAVIGLSGGLDSTLALLVAVKAFDLMNKSREKISCITLPCFGTTEKTKNNAVVLAQTLGCTIRTVDIGKAVTQHFEDIGHSSDKYDVTFENAQARERTQVLMDIANMEGGLVIGTGDLSELALGWATYNGDHMANYSVNGSIPKTLVRALVKHYADSADNEVLIETLYSILGTPISPELIPGGKQATEDLVGPYELHDFFLWHLLVNSYTPSKILRLACYVFEGLYSPETIEKWLKTFCRRFFIQQFKRSCLPDGPKAGVLSLSPRGAWEMPSDADFSAWI